MAKRNTNHWQTTFLDALSASGNVAQAARAAGVGVSTAYRHRKQNDLFREAWAEALGAEAENEAAPEPGASQDDPPGWPPADIVGALEREAWRRAVEGYEYPVTSGGQITDTYHKYSDTLLVFLLKAHCPEKYVRPGEGDDQDDGPVTFRVVYNGE